MIHKMYKILSSQKHKKKTHIDIGKYRLSAIAEKFISDIGYRPKFSYRCIPSFLNKKNLKYFVFGSLLTLQGRPSG